MASMYAVAPLRRQTGASITIMDIADATLILGATHTEIDASTLYLCLYLDLYLYLYHNHIADATLILRAIHTEVDASTTGCITQFKRAFFD